MSLPRKAKPLIIGLLVGAVSAVIAGIMAKVSPIFIVAAVLPVLFVAGATYWLFTRINIETESAKPQESNVVFWLFLIISLPFFGGALYGLLDSIREGWKALDMIPVMITTLIGSYFLWAGMKVRRKRHE